MKITLKNEGNLKNEDGLKNGTVSEMKTTQKWARPQQHYLKKLLMTPHLDRHSYTAQNAEIRSAVKARVRILCDERNLHGIRHAYMFRKDDFLNKDN